VSGPFRTFEIDLKRNELRWVVGPGEDDIEFVHASRFPGGPHALHLVGHRFARKLQHIWCAAVDEAQVAVAEHIRLDDWGEDLRLGIQRTDDAVRPSQSQRQERLNLLRWLLVNVPKLRKQHLNVSCSHAPALTTVPHSEAARSTDPTPSVLSGISR